ncbi:MAG: transglycosylase SLT domain-containing protein [Halieaceae bacterium]|jgi:hypothetical protein|nr:transglycosylase SLT domain-containing protein [Halieaceae bacterium]
MMALAGCVTPPPDDVDNICAIFEERDDWYDAAKESRARWGVPITVMMAIMHQESRFVATAKPPRKMIWGFIPGPRPSDAYGYSQAKDSTWEWYEKSSGNYGADRDNFDDAIDFVGWYCHVSKQQNGIATDDTFRQYLAYHEGHGGYARKTFRDKTWLVDVARKVDKRAKRYNAQLTGCRQQLESKPWWQWW